MSGATEELMSPHALPAPRRAGEAQARRRQRHRQLRERAIELAFTVVGFTGIAAVALILIFVAREALPLLTDPAARVEASLSKLFLPQVLRAGRPATFMWQPVGDVPKLSMVPLFIGTLKVTLVSMAIAAPMGIAAAIYVSEFAGPKMREWLKPAIELLAGIPSVV